MIEDGAKLVVQGFEVGSRVGLALLVPVGQQLVLPCDHVLGGDLANLPLAKVGQNFLLDDVLLGQPGVLLEPGFHILGVKLGKGFKGHIQVAGGLHLETALPLLGLPFGGKATLALLFALPRPVLIPHHDVPCSSCFVLKDWHLVPFLSGPVEPFVEILAVDPPCDGDEALVLQFFVELPDEFIGVGLRYTQLVRNFFRPDESVLHMDSSFLLI